MTRPDISAIVERVVAATVQDIGADATVTASSRFGPDLGMDELDIDHMMIELGVNLNVTLPLGEISKKSTVSDLVDLVLDRIKGGPVGLLTRGTRGTAHEHPNCH